MITERVNLSERSYDIKIGGGAIKLAAERAQGLAKEHRPLVCITDENVNEIAKAHIRAISENAIILPAGETTKSFYSAEKLCAELAELKVDRSGAIFAIGGGVIGDLAGFVASIFLRGVDFYQVPTTLLSMVDSSVGGKTGINIAHGKNLVGAFYQPQEVFIDTDFLKTLPKREFAAGMAEVIKYGMLWDEGLFKQLEEKPLRPDSEELAEVIRRCCAIKAAIVSADERETAKDGGRALLNLGHTFGHAVEKCAGYGEYLHGEAVGMGLLLSARLSAHFGYISQSDVERVKNVLIAHQIPVRLVTPISAEHLTEATRKDKKVKFGKLKFVLLERMGKAFTKADVPEDLTLEMFKTL